VSKKAAKRTKTTKALPLVSPHWWPREKTVVYCRAHGGEIADVALTTAVKAGELPVKLEWVDHGTRPPVQRSILLSAKDYEFGPYISSNFLVVQPRRPDVPPLPRPHALSFWGPKAKELWPAEEAEPVSTEQQAVDPLAPPPRRRGPVLTHDWFSICGEIARRCIDPKTKRVAVPKNENKFAEAMLDWLSEQGIDPPASSEMREAVRRIFAALRTV
jgi:hypothetical protein